MLTLTIRIEDSDNPSRRRERVVEARDLYDALYELKNVAGPGFAAELMKLSWSLLTPPQPPPGNTGVPARFEP